MRRTLPDVNFELAAAVRRVNALYRKVPDEHRPDATGERWDALEAELDARCGAGDRAGALRAIADWEQHVTGVLTRALLYAPIEPDREVA